jgi:SAM-dependent methyltransferase
MKMILVPASATHYILYQRTRYLKDNILAQILSRFEKNRFFYKWSKAIQSKLFRKTIHNKFIEDLENDFGQINPFLPSQSTSILDIGCGVAGIDVLISRFYKHTVDIYLLDKTHTDSDIYYGFQESGSYYNSLEIAKQVLEENGTPSGNIHMWDTSDSNNLFAQNSFDVVISLLSWGFHYPISTYIEKVYKSLKTGGVLIIDIREKTDGADEIKKIFGNFRVIYKSKDYRRILAKK